MLDLTRRRTRQGLDAAGGAYEGHGCRASEEPSAAYRKLARMPVVPRRTGIEELRLQMAGRRPPDPVLLLGAGASVKSGVPSAADLVTMAGKWAWCQANAREFDDQSVVPSDWHPWLHGQDWFDAGRPLAELYPIAVERFLRPAESRRRFFRTVLGGDVRPSEGYAALGTLLAARAVLTVLTVNFDGLVAKAAPLSANVR